MIKPRLTAAAGPAERLVSLVEGAGWADALARGASRLFRVIVKPGPAKNLLSGSTLGHPAHPMLTDVTIGAWTSAFFLDLIPRPWARSAADQLIGVGVASAVPTALTGLSDLSDTTGRARPLGGAHAAGNTIATALYATSFVLRRRGRRSAGIATGMAAATVASVAGFLGGHLAYRRGVGVDRTVFERHIDEWTRVAAEDNLIAGKPQRVTVLGNDVLVLRADDSVVAMADRCSHRGGPLHKGTVDADRIVCPWHSSAFRISDGALLCGPAVAPQPVYDVRVRDGAVEIRSR